MNTTALIRVALSVAIAATTTPAWSAPVPTPKATAMEAARFLQQASFGPTADSVASVQALGLSAWIDQQIALDKTKWSPIPDPSVDAKGNTSLAPAQEAFFVNAVNGQDQLRQRVAFALGQILVVSGVKLRPEAMVPYLRMLQEDAFLTYDHILRDVTLSPAMGHYLDMVNNAKATPGHSPDENYAREIMQLFSIGLVELDSYGRPVLNSSHNPIPTYSQDTIEGFARAFTGWTYAPKAGATNSHFGNPANWNAPMVAFDNFHDTGAKPLLNNFVSPPNQTAEQDLAAALNNIFNHPNVPPFICKEMIQRLVTSSPSPNYIHRCVATFDAKPRGDMAAVVKAILLDPEARKGDDGSENVATKLQEPVLWTSRFLRGLNAKVVSPNSLTGANANLGQTIYYPATVFNYFLPGYEIDLSPTQTYNAPEFQLLSEATATAAADLVSSFTYGAPAGVTIDLTPYITPLGAKPAQTDVSKMVDQLNMALMGGRMPATMHDTIVQAAMAQATPKAMVQTAVYLIGSSWNFQVER